MLLPNIDPGIDPGIDSSMDPGSTLLGSSLSYPKDSSPARKIPLEGLYPGLSIIPWGPKKS